MVRKGKGNNWVGVFDFLPSKGNREKSKTPTWSDDEGGAEHTKNSCMIFPVFCKSALPYGDLKGFTLLFSIIFIINYYSYISFRYFSFIFPVIILRFTFILDISTFSNIIKTDLSHYIIFIIYY
jgi:hypothetical protein